VGTPIVKVSMGYGPDIEAQLVGFTLTRVGTAPPLLTGPGGGGGTNPNIVNVAVPGTIVAANNTEYYIDFNVVGGNVTFNTSSLLPSDSFYVKIIDPSNVGTGGHKAVVDPIVAGSHIENINQPGTLTTEYDLTQPGQEASFTTNDGINLWT
jgi:hypothetical protein